MNFHRRPITGPVVTAHTAELYDPLPGHLLGRALHEAGEWVRAHALDLRDQLPSVRAYAGDPGVVDLMWLMHHSDAGEQALHARHVWRTLGVDTVWSSLVAEAVGDLPAVVYWTAERGHIRFTVSVSADVDVPFGTPAAIPAVTP